MHKGGGGGNYLQKGQKRRRAGNMQFFFFLGGGAVILVGIWYFLENKESWASKCFSESLPYPNLNPDVDLNQDPD
jgi:hypothetical protein